MSILTLTALVLVTEEFHVETRKIGDVICTTAPGHCGHNYAYYRVDGMVRSERGTWKAVCSRVVAFSKRNEDGTFSTGWREVAADEIKPGTGLLKDGVRG